MMRTRTFALILSLALSVAWRSSASAATCDSPAPEWLACEDFEDGALGWEAWFAQSPWVECNGCSSGTNNPDRIQLLNDASAAHSGNWSLYMPGAAAANYNGAALAFRSCAGDKASNCTLTNYDQLYFRAWVKRAPDHAYVHHFLSISGTRPQSYWESDGNAGCRPNGYRAAGTTLDFNEDHELFFYTYFPDMRCDSGGYCSGSYAQNICNGCAAKDMACDNGLECCWGNHFQSETPVLFPRGEWVCLEIMMKLNTPGAADGEMAYWINDELGHHQTGMHWRDTADLGLNKAWLQHYIDDGDTDQPNRIWFDDIVVSTARIGCGGTPPADPDAGPGGGGGNGGGNGGGSDNDGGDQPDGASGCGCQAAGPGVAGAVLGWLFVLGFVRKPQRRRR